MPPKKGSKKVPESEPEPELETPVQLDAPPEPAPQPMDPFQQLHLVWQHSDKRRRKAEVAALLFLAAGNDNSIEGLLIDQALEHLTFAKSVGMNGAQSKECYRILEDTRVRCVAGAAVRTNFGVFKEAVLSNSMLKTSMQEVLAAEAVAASVDDAGSRESRVVVEGEEGLLSKETSVVALPKGMQNRLFTSQMVKQVCDYAAKGVFAHYRLYQSVFTAQKFQPRKRVVENALKIDSVLPDTLKLDEARDPRAARAVPVQLTVE